MALDVSGFGLVINIIASNTYPTGITISQWDVDADPIDFPSVKIGDAVMGLNGDLILFSKAVPLPCTVNVIPGSQDDINLQILADANRVAQGKASAQDIITLTAIYPDSSLVTLTGGKMIEGQFGKTLQSSGRLKVKSYGFIFQNKIGI